MILFLILGFLGFAVGLLSIFSSRFDEYVHTLFPDTELDRKLFSEGERYFLRRYLSGIRGILFGVAGVALYIITNDQLLNTLTGWFHQILSK